MQSAGRQVPDRARLARELHDGIAQDLVGVGYCLDLLLADPDASVESRSQLRALRFTVTDLIDKVRKEIYFLRQPSQLSLAQAIRVSAQELLRGVELNVDVDEMKLGLDSDLAYEIHRIAQEVFRNISAHAQATTVSISIHLGESEILLHIADDGVGGAIESDSQYGIRSIKDRATLIEGSLEISSGRNGTQITLKVPYENHVLG